MHPSAPRSRLRSHFKQLAPVSARHDKQGEDVLLAFLICLQVCLKRRNADQQLVAAAHCRFSQEGAGLGTAQQLVQNEEAVAVQRRVASSRCCIVQLLQHSRSWRPVRSFVGVKPTELAHMQPAVICKLSRHQRGGAESHRTVRRAWTRAWMLAELPRPR